jgi:hypothetical protein
MECNAEHAASPHPNGTDRPESPVSVRELVRRRLGKEFDSWDLALVQRAEVWDQVRMRHLLDSLLAGYPIGALLLCRVADPSYVIRPEDREPVEAGAAAWQLLDGQQRINALYSMLTTEGRYGRFYLNMMVRRVAPGPVSQKRTKERALSYIGWQSDPDAPELEPQPREFHIDLSRWSDWAELHPKRPEALKPQKAIEEAAEQATLELTDVEADRVAEILCSIDPKFTSVLDSSSAALALGRLTKLWEVWWMPLIPVLTTEVQTPLDVLEVFTRINRGGVQVASTDVYLAAVKTFWPDAEKRLDRLVGASRPVHLQADGASNRGSPAAPKVSGPDGCSPIRVTIGQPGTTTRRPAAVEGGPPCRRTRPTPHPRDERAD